MSNEKENILDFGLNENEESVWLRLGYAGFWERVLAYLVDAFVLMIPIMILQSGLVNIPFGRGIIMDQIVNLGAWWVYMAFMESSAHQATIGKKALKLKVVDTKGNRISFGRASFRFWGILIAMIPLGIGIVMIAWDEKKQGLQDKLAECLVVRV